MALTFFNPLPCTAGYQGTKVRNGLDTSPGPPLNTNARCTSPASSGIDVRGSAHAPAPRPRPRWPSCWGCRHEHGPSAPSHRLGFVRMTTAVQPWPGEAEAPRRRCGVPAARTRLPKPATREGGLRGHSSPPPWSWHPRGRVRGLVRLVLYRASTAAPPAAAQLRDQVLQAGEQAVQNFNTLDYRKVAAGLALWEQSSTGPLHAEISAGRTQFDAADRADQDGHHGPDPRWRAHRAEPPGRHGQHRRGRADHRDPGQRVAGHQAEPAGSAR